jgi:hypothetical protein
MRDQVLRNLTLARRQMGLFDFQPLQKSHRNFPVSFQPLHAALGCSRNVFAELMK